MNERACRSVGIRPILHAALIFDPDFIPPPINYQLPRRPKPSEIAYENSHKESIGRSGLVTNEKETRRSEEGTESTAQFSDQGADKSNVIYHAHSNNAPWHETAPNDHIPPNPLSYQHSDPFSDLMLEIEAALDTSSEASPIDEEVVGQDSFPNSTYDSSSYNSTKTSQTSSQRNSLHTSAFAVTEEELELLDYDGTRGRRGNDALYTCMERTASVDIKECEDEEADLKVRARRVRWSV